MKIGVQLYTLRDYCTTLDDFAETLKKVADMGFSTVQVSGTCAFEAEWLRDALKAAGLTCNLTHFNYDRIVNETEKVVNEHNTFGCRYIGIGALPGVFSKETEKVPGFVKDFVEKAKPAAQKIAEMGSYFMYHNHGVEYRNIVDGVNCMEYLSNAFAPEEMGFTLDTYWVTDGGSDPIKEIERLAGRLPVVHFKDYKEEADGTHHFTWCGDGILNFEKIGAALEKAGTDYVYIEQDKTFPDMPDPFDCLKNSRAHLKSLGFEF